MEIPLTVIVCLVAVFLAALFSWRAGRASAPTQAGEGAADDSSADPKPLADPAGAGSGAESKAEPPKPLHELAADLDEPWDQAPTLEAARSAEKFTAARAAVEASGVSEEDLFGYLRRSGGMASILALEALAGRQGVDADRLREALLARIENTGGSHREHAFRVLHESAREPVVPAVMTMLHRNLYAWDDADAAEALRDFLILRREAGEEPSFGERAPKFSEWDLSNFEDILRRLPEDLAKPLRDGLKGAGGGVERWKPFFSGFARVLDPVGDALEDGSPMVRTPELEQAAARLEGMLLGGDGETIRCPLLVGEEGCGKSVLLRCVVKRLQDAGFTVVEASGPDIVSGQCYLGDLEKRVRGMVEALEKEKFVWLVPSLAELVDAGKTRASEAGVFDLILPHLLRGGIRMLAEIRPGVLDKLLGEVPRVSSAMTVARIGPASEQSALSIAAEWLRGHPGERGAKLRAGREQLAEGCRLAEQYFPGPALPGRLFTLVRAALHRVAETGGGTRELDRALLLESISDTTGMPIELLDDERPLDLEAVRARFASTVMGQPEAVDALVARLAMMKAGLTDPSRPQGVFLFAGPTGTGKTELAKCLAGYLFGSAERMLRIDMSELQGGNLHRLTGSPASGAPTSLASMVRQQPFSVVLLDEFEKADPSAWDLFLQVFDDGRLTDGSGNTADFRQSIIILTTNLGARVAQGVPLGFGAGTHEDFRPDEIEKAVAAAFRPEFVNRIDRLLCFRPLSRETMRSILSAELRKAAGRRGLRQRPWVLEFDASATEFLLAKGFSPTLGARPLQRAIDRFLLGPMAEAVVRGELPSGEDLVFVYEKEGRLRWDLASVEDAVVEAEPGELPSLSLRQMVLGPAGSRGEVEALDRRLAELAGLIELDAFHQRRAEIFGRMADEGFWTSPERFAVLGEAEYLDRIENAVAAARRTVGRLARQEPGSAAARGLVSKMALRVHLLESAWPDIAEGKGPAAWVGLRAVERNEKSAALGEALAGMIEGWADARGMQIEALKLPDWDRGWAIEGFAALRILELENGLHVGEEGGLGETSRVQISVARQAAEPAAVLPEPLGRAAARALEGAASDELVRKYQDRPTPLVRDRRRGFRTGRLDLVLAGHFDLM